MKYPFLYCVVAALCAFIAAQFEQPVLMCLFAIVAVVMMLIANNNETDELYGPMRRLSLQATDFAAGDEVLYIPRQAEGNRRHPGCEKGHVTSVNDIYVFVRFGGAISQACAPHELEKQG